MTYIVVIIDDVYVKKVIGKCIMILECLVIIFPTVFSLPHPDQLSLTWRNQQYFIGRHDIHGVLRLLKVEHVVGYVIHGSVNFVDAANITGSHVIFHHVAGNIFWLVPPIFYKIRIKYNKLT